jgi:hypothetical protein
MGTIGSRELECASDIHHKQILETIHGEVVQEDYKMYELDWMLALEVRKPLPYNHRTMDCNVRCWHGMKDDVAPLGTFN